MAAPSSPPPPGGMWSPTPNAPMAVMPPPVAAHEEGPIGAMILSIIGGVFILIGAAVALWLGSLVRAFAFGFYGSTFLILGAIGAVLGILTIVFGVLLYVHPAHRTVYGVLIIVFSIASWVTAFGGFFIGFLLALIGGILALTYKPTPPPMVWVAPVQRVCPKCGRVVDPNVRFCPACGNALG